VPRSFPQLAPACPHWKRAQKRWRLPTGSKRSWEWKDHAPGDSRCEASPSKRAPLLNNRGAKVQSYLSKVGGGPFQGRDRCLTNRAKISLATPFVHNLSTREKSWSGPNARFAAVHEPFVVGEKSLAITIGNGIRCAGRIVPSCALLQARFVTPDPPPRTTCGQLVMPVHSKPFLSDDLPPVQQRLRKGGSRLKGIPGFCQAGKMGYLSDLSRSFGFFCPHVTGWARCPYTRWIQAVTWRRPLDRVSDFRRFGRR
jgi:hypothetical protein